MYFHTHRSLCVNPGILEDEGAHASSRCGAAEAHAARAGGPGNWGRGANFRPLEHYTEGMIRIRVRLMTFNHIPTAALSWSTL